MNASEKKQRIEKLYSKGQSIDDISQQLGIPRSTIYYHLDKLGICRSVKSGLKIAKQKGKIYSDPPQILTDPDLFRKEYESKSLTQLSAEYGVSRKRLSRFREQLGIERKQWNQKNRAKQVVLFEKKFPKLQDKDWLEGRYLELNSMEKLADEIGVSITAVRSRLKKFGIPIRRKGDISQTNHRSSRGRMVRFLGQKASKKYTFRSFLEAGFAMLLDEDPSVEKWEYEYIRYAYFDGFTGKQKTYVCDFYVEKIDGSIEQVEVKPINQQFPLDKYIYAKNCMTGWRWTTQGEIESAYSAFKSGKFSVEFLNRLPKTKYYNWYSSSADEVFPAPWRIKRKSTFGAFYCYQIVNDQHSYRPKTKSIKLDLDVVLSKIKSGLTQKQIAKECGVDARTIRNFLERNSYTIKWRPVVEIRRATQLVWSSEPNKILNPGS